MWKMRDDIILGMLSGMISGIPDTVKNVLDYRAGRADVSYGQVGAGLFYPPGQTRKPEALATGYIANAAMTGLAGVLFRYLLNVTGRDRAVAKGIALGVASWLGVFGLGVKTLLPDRRTRPLTPLLSLVDHVIFGTMLGVITPMLAGDSLHPGHGRERMPLRLSEASEAPTPRRYSEVRT